MSNIHTLTETETFELPKRAFNELMANNRDTLKRTIDDKITLESRLKINEEKMKMCMEALNKLKIENQRLMNKVKSHSSSKIENTAMFTDYRKMQEKHDYYESHKTEIIDAYIKEHHSGELDSFQKELDSFFITTNDINGKFSGRGHRVNNS